MSEFIKWLWQFNLEVSLLLLATLLARAVLRRFTRTYNNYLLWFSIPMALIVAKGLTTMEFSSPIAAQAQPLRAAVDDYSIRAYIVQPAESFDAWAMFGVIAAILLSLLLLRLVFQHWNLRQELRRVSRGIHPQLSSSFPVVTVNKDGFSPAVYGFFRPTIYFPLELTETLSPAQVSLIIQHEEQHIRQGHLWLNLFWDVLVCVLWFNPLVYFARQGFRHDQELYCDYLVLKNSDQHDRLSYGHALLSTVSATHSVSLLCSWKMFNQLEERIMNIKSTFNLQKKLLIGSISALLVLCASTYSLAMAGGEEKEKAQVRIVVDKESKSKVKLENNDLTYIEENGERFLEVDGERREMTEAEQAEYEQLMEAAHIEGAIEVEIEGSLPSRKVVSIKTFQGGLDELELAEVLHGLEGLKGLEGLSALKGLKGLEALEALEGLADIDVEIVKGHHSKLSMAEHELEAALHSLERAKEHEHADKAQLKRSTKELKKIQKQLAKEEHECTEKTREKARIAAKKAREQIIRRDAI